MVKLRLARQGRKKVPIYKIVAADSRSRRDGRFIEALGQYRPQNENGTKTILNEEREDTRVWRAAAVAYYRQQLTAALELMGCSVPAKM